MLSLVSMYSFLWSDTFITWLVGIPVLYLIVNILIRLGLFGGQWPKTVRGTDGASMLAFEIVSCSICLYVGVAGTIAWFKLCSSCDLEGIENDKLYGRSIFFEEHLAAPLLSYQFWNFVICLVIREMRDKVMLLHHVSSGLCALFSLHPFLQYYGLFFFGVPEVTSVPLTFVSLTKSFPFLKTNYPQVYEVSKWSFGVLFLVIRLVMWTHVSVYYWMDTVTLIRSGAAHSNFVLFYYCFANVVLSGMQYFWGYKIVSQMRAGPKAVSKKN